MNSKRNIQVVVLFLITIAIYLLMWNRTEPHYSKLKYPGHFNNTHVTDEEDNLVSNKLSLHSDIQSTIINLSRVSNSVMNSVTAYTHIHRGCEGRKFLVYKCSNGCGGWGDRQKGIISTFLLALLTNRTFVIDMFSPCSLQTIVQPNIYNWTECLPVIRKANISKHHTREVYSMNAGNTLLKELDGMVFEEAWKECIINLHTNALLINKIRSHPKSKQMINWLHNSTIEKVIHDVLSALFKPKNRLVNHMKDFLSNYIERKTLICCHIRCGRNPTIPNDGTLREGRPNITKVFSFLEQYKSSKKYALYIATDSEDVRKEANKLFSNYMSINRTIVHVDKASRRNSNEACEGFYTAIFEQTLLSICDVLVLTRSNFGAMAAYMRGRSDKLYLYHKQSQSVKHVSVFDIQQLYGFV